MSQVSIVILRGYSLVFLQSGTLVRLDYLLSKAKFKHWGVVVHRLHWMYCRNVFCNLTHCTAAFEQLQLFKSLLLSKFKKKATPISMKKSK